LRGTHAPRPCRRLRLVVQGLGGPFHPKGTAASEYLAHYAKSFPIVEIDSTFYASPRAAVVNGWRDKTPPGFRFCLKVPQTITHEKTLENCQDDTDGFLTAARLLGDKLACCVLQFGYFNKKAFESIEPFLERLEAYLEEWPNDVPLAVEIRNKTWIGTDFLSYLRSHKAAFVLTDQAWLPSPMKLIETLEVIIGPSLRPIIEPTAR
jgi:uncharacterized protein YecE (DUF72 family)